MPKPLTDLERRVLAYLVEYLRRNTYQPSIREIGREFTIKSTKTVSELLQSLADKGWIERDPSRSRGVRLLGLDTEVDTVTVPLLAAGDGAAREVYVLDRRLVGAVGVFLVVMEGTHLLPLGIQPGDLLLVEPVNPAALGVDDLVYASAAAPPVRRCVQAGADAIVLEDGAGGAPLTIPRRQSNSAVQGRVTGVVRRLRVAPAHGALEPVPTT